MVAGAREGRGALGGNIPRVQADQAYRGPHGAAAHGVARQAFPSDIRRHAWAHRAGGRRNRYVLHAECPFTRYAWLKAAHEDTDEVWARCLA